MTYSNNGCIIAAMSEFNPSRRRFLKFVPAAIGVGLGLGLSGIFAGCNPFLLPDQKQIDTTPKALPNEAKSKLLEERIYPIMTDFSNIIGWNDDQLHYMESLVSIGPDGSDSGFFTSNGTEIIIHESTLSRENLTKDRSFLYRFYRELSLFDIVEIAEIGSYIQRLINGHYIGFYDSQVIGFGFISTDNSLGAIIRKNYLDKTYTEIAARIGTEKAVNPKLKDKTSEEIMDEIVAERARNEARVGSLPLGEARKLLNNEAARSPLAQAFLIQKLRGTFTFKELAEKHRHSDLWEILEAITGRRDSDMFFAIEEVFLYINAGVIFTLQQAHDFFQQLVTFQNTV